MPMETLYSTVNSDMYSMSSVGLQPVTIPLQIHVRLSGFIIKNCQKLLYSISFFLRGLICNFIENESNMKDGTTSKVFLFTARIVHYLVSRGGVQLYSFPGRE